MLAHCNADMHVWEYPEVDTNTYLNIFDLNTILNLITDAWIFFKANEKLLMEMYSVGLWLCFALVYNSQSFLLEIICF